MNNSDQHFPLQLGLFAFSGFLFSRLHIPPCVKHTSACHANRSTMCIVFKVFLKGYMDV